MESTVWEVFTHKKTDAASSKKGQFGEVGDCLGIFQFSTILAYKLTGLLAGGGKLGLG